MRLLAFVALVLSSSSAVADDDSDRFIYPILSDDHGRWDYVRRGRLTDPAVTIEIKGTVWFRRNGRDWVERSIVTTTRKDPDLVKVGTAVVVHIEGQREVRYSVDDRTGMREPPSHTPMGVRQEPRRSFDWAQRIGSDKRFGLPCNGWRFYEPTTVWYCHAIPVEEKTASGDLHVTLLDLGARVSDDLFRVPSDVTLTDWQ
jgi:hypothetical protein